MTTTIPALAVSSLSAGYRGFDAVRDVSLHVAPGEAAALIGPNRAGKTSVLRAIMGLVPHRRGSIRVNGTELTHLATHEIARGHAALAPAGRRLFGSQSVADNLLLGGLYLDKARMAALLASVYDVFPVLHGYRGRPAAALTAGQQQMVAIGRMMMSDPALMLLDEPSHGLAPDDIEAVGEALVRLRRQGRSLLLAEQRVSLALDVCDRHYGLSGGALMGQNVIGVRASA